MSVRVVISCLVLASGLVHTSVARALEPWERPIPPAPDVSTQASEAVQGGIAASFVFAAFGLGTGAAAAEKDAESERRRDDPCRSCEGGFNDLQREMATLANASLFAFLAAGGIGVGTAIYAISIDDVVTVKKKKKAPPVKASVFVQGSMLGVDVRF